MRRRRTAIADPRATDGAPRPDRGVTFVEILVAVVLLGTVVVAVLTALQVSIRGSVTQDEKVEALSVLEAASSALKEQGDCADYSNRAKAAVEDPDWAADLVVVADCTSDPDFDRVVLTANSPRGLQEQLTVLVGGPRIRAGTGGNGDEEEPFVVVPCAVTSVNAAPTDAELDPVDGLVGLGVLPQNVVVAISTDTQCQSAYLRARLSPAPLDNAGVPIPPPPFQLDTDTGDYVLTLETEIWRWRTGTYDVDIELVRSDTEIPITAWSVDGLFELTCAVATEPENASIVRSGATGQLLADLPLTVTPSPACAVPATLSYTVDTGTGIASGSFTNSDGTWSSSILGEPSGSQFTPGPKLIEIFDETGAVVTTIEIEVQP